MVVKKKRIDIHSNTLYNDRRYKNRGSFDRRFSHAAKKQKQTDFLGTSQM